jgi:hypothetical protein
LHSLTGAVSGASGFREFERGRAAASVPLNFLEARF